MISLSKIFENWGISSPRYWSFTGLTNDPEKNKKIMKSRKTKEEIWFKKVSKQVEHIVSSKENL